MANTSDDVPKNEPDEVITPDEAADDRDSR